MNGFKVSGVWTFFGVALFLIFIYLILTHYVAAKSVGGTLFGGVNNLFTTLQGRSASSAG